MKPSFHEDFTRPDEVKSGTDRGFGLTVGGILLALAVVRAFLHGRIGWLEPIFAVVGIVLIGLALIAPSSLAGAHRAWVKLGLVMFKVVNPIVLSAIFVIAVVPVGLIMRALGKDPLNLKPDPSAKSYWIERTPPGPAPDSMVNQF